jgi:NADH:ubiquinone oxidoreductase subunit 2 (subunit N)
MRGGYFNFKIMLKILEKPLKIWEIIMSIYIIGLISIYNIFTYGLDQIINKDNIGGILNINENNLKYLIFINILILLIFNSNVLFEQSLGIKSIEFIYLIAFGLLGLNLIILSNDLILIFIAIELYSLSVYLLILLKISKIKSRISIIYLLINSISSYLFLLGIAIIYKYSGSIVLEEIMYIININNDTENINKIIIGILLLVLAILLKLGTVPFNFWVLRLYSALESRILLYQIIIPKLVFIYLLYKIFNTLFILPITQFNITHNLSFINSFYYLFFIISILSVIIGSIAGLFHNFLKALLTYSSILNIGFILLGLSNELIKYSNIQLINWDIIGGSITFIEFLFIYTINSLSIFFCFLLINPKKSNEIPLFQSINKNSLNKSFNVAYNYPILSLFLLFSIFSFIGIPPFAGFFAKINIFINILYSYNILSIFAIFFLLLSTFISACFYLKFLLYFFFPLKVYNFNKINTIEEQVESFLISEKPISLSYFFSFFSLLLLLYPFLSNFFYPFFYTI